MPFVKIFDNIVIPRAELECPELCFEGHSPILTKFSRLCRQLDSVNFIWDITKLISDVLTSLAVLCAEGWGRSGIYGQGFV